VKLNFAIRIEQLNVWPDSVLSVYWELLPLNFTTVPKVGTVIIAILQMRALIHRGT
jgi:hypothetical protein